jgi:hypothetical protein
VLPQFKIKISPTAEKNRLYYGITVQVAFPKGRVTSNHLIKSSFHKENQEAEHHLFIFCPFSLPTVSATVRPSEGKEKHKIKKLKKEPSLFMVNLTRTPQARRTV